MTTDWPKWLDQALSHWERTTGLKKTQMELAAAVELMLGINFDKSKINKSLAGTRKLKPDEIMAISKATGFPAPIDEASKVAAIDRAPVVGIVSTGYWFENDMELDQDAQADIPFVPGKYTGLKQFAYRVQGVSMNADRIFDGDYVICVPYFEARAQLTGGDTVVVRRRRGHLTELTCKRLIQARAGFELWSKSTDEQYQAPLVFVESGAAEDETVIEVVGLVVGVFSPR